MSILLTAFLPNGCVCYTRSSAMNVIWHQRGTKRNPHTIVAVATDTARHEYLCVKYSAGKDTFKCPRPSLLERSVIVSVTLKTSFMSRIITGLWECAISSPLVFYWDIDQFQKLRTNDAHRLSKSAKRLFC